LRIIVAVLTALQTFFMVGLRGQSPVALADRLQQATELTSLDAEGSKPWHLKLELQLFDKDGKPSETGTVEEWWASPTLNRVVYTSPSGTTTVVRNADGGFRTAGSTADEYLLDLMRRQVVHPMPSDGEVSGAKLEERIKTFGQVKLDCVLLTQEIRGVSKAPDGLFPTYCLEHDGHSLRLAYDFDSLVITRNNMGKFAEKMVPLEATAASGGKTLVSLRVAALQTAVLTAADFVPGDDLKKVGDGTAKVSSAVIAGMKLSGTDAIYPRSALARGISGSVVMRAIVGQDGRIQRLTLMSYPDGDLAISALTAVRLWTYKPYILNGNSTEVDTTITVNYNFGP
jgi:TonB family protein